MLAVIRENFRGAGPPAGRIIAGIWLVFLALSACRQPHEFGGTLLSTPVAAPETVLESADGPRSLRDFAGRYTALYFGYTYCPDVCPATMATLKRVKAELGDDGAALQVVMVTVDPERDTPEALAEYLAHFDDSFVGLSGNDAALDEAGAPFGLYYARHEGTGASGYLVDHTAAVFLLDRESNAIVIYPHDMKAETLVKDLQFLLRTEG